MFLKPDYCVKLYEQQKHKENKKNSMSLESITYNFVILRTFLVARMNQFVSNCYLLRLSQIVFNGVSFVSKLSFFDPITTQLDSSFLSTNPCFACFVGYLLFLVNKTIIRIVQIYLIFEPKLLHENRIFPKFHN